MDILRWIIAVIGIGFFVALVWVAITSKATSRKGIINEMRIQDAKAELRKRRKRTRK